VVIIRSKSGSASRRTSAASLERDDYFQIESIPFFLKEHLTRRHRESQNVTNSEIDKGEVFEFDTVLDRAGHNTYRLLLKNKYPDDPHFTESELPEEGAGGCGTRKGIDTWNPANEFGRRPFWRAGLV
jgi:hypothetical protein